MSWSRRIRAGVVGLLAVASLAPAEACCPAPPAGRPVLNSDQTVILIWDKASRTQHFIRRASFRGESRDFGFLVPTPAEPELDEAGSEAFPLFEGITAPVVQVRERMPGIGCSAEPSVPAPSASVRVLQEKVVAGLQAAVLAADSSSDLVDWLRDHGYEHSPAIAEWVQPYVEQGWLLTALKVADPQAPKGDRVEASALRISFQTDAPLFPYREPYSEQAISAVQPPERLLRIYFVGEARYRGSLSAGAPWTGRVAWSGPLDASSRQEAVRLLGLGDAPTPPDWWLTEFEDPWPYAKAASDLVFQVDADQSQVRRPPLIQFVDAPLIVQIFPCFAVLLLAAFPLLLIVRLTRRANPAA